MLRDGEGFKRVIVCCGRVDLRKGIDGLAAYVRLNYGLNPIEKGTLFLFCGTRSDRIKGLVFEGDGFCMLYKRLAGGNRFKWPRSPLEARELSTEQFRRLMDGFTMDGSIKEIYPYIEQKNEAKT